MKSWIKDRKENINNLKKIEIIPSGKFKANGKKLVNVNSLGTPNIIKSDSNKKRIKSVKIDKKKESLSKKSKEPKKAKNKKEDRKLISKNTNLKYKIDPNKKIKINNLNSPYIPKFNKQKKQNIPSSNLKKEEIKNSEDKKISTKIIDKSKIDKKLVKLNNTIPHHASPWPTDQKQKSRQYLPSKDFKANGFFPNVNNDFKIDNNGFDKEQIKQADSPKTLKIENSKKEEELINNQKIVKEDIKQQEIKQIDQNAT